MAKRPRKLAALKRRAPKREPYERVLIVCEGQRTEPIYFNGLRDHYALSSANIAVTPADGSDPVSIVRYAKELQKNEKRRGEQFDKIYCVFDRDEHANFNAAYDQLVANKFESARSWPCFEYWLLLHFGYQRNPFPPKHRKSSAQNCQATLRKKLAAYTKGMQGLFAELLPRLEDAKRNAKRAQMDVVKTGNEHPSTEIHSLVEYLQNLKPKL